MITIFICYCNVMYLHKSTIVADNNILMTIIIFYVQHALLEETPDYRTTCKTLGQKSPKMCPHHTLCILSMEISTQASGWIMRNMVIFNGMF